MGLRHYFTRKKRERELAEELRAHREMAEDDLRSSGMSESDARFAAQRAMGNMTMALEDSRAAWNSQWIESMFLDARYAIRSFLRAPMFALTVIGTIGLALGLNTTLFTIFNAYVLRPLSVRDPYSLYQFNWITKGGDFHALSPPEFEKLRRDNPVFSDVVASAGTVTRSGGRHLLISQVSTNTFSVLGVDASLGRPILPGDAGVAVLSDAAWTNKFGGDARILGQKLEILGASYEIVGIARPVFTGLTDASLPDAWIPLLESGPDVARGLSVVGRVKPGVTPRQAKAALGVWVSQATADLPDSQRANVVRLESAATSIHWNRKMLAVFAPLLAAFGLVLIIACANVANMMLARAMARQREIGVRLSLGAGRTRLIRQLLTESFLLAIPAALAGLLISQATIRFTEDLMFRTMPPILGELVHLVALTPDFRVFLFILAAAAASTLLSGLVPAIQATRPGLLYATRGDFSADFHPARLRSALVVSQVTVCVLLLICSGVLLRASRKIQESDVRIVASGVLEITAYGNPYAKIAERLDREAWIESTGSLWRAPLMGPLRTLPVAPGARSEFVRAGYNFVSPQYFPIFRIPLVRGRNFSVEESRSGAPVVIVSEATAARLWPGQEVLGQTLRIAPEAHQVQPAFHAARVIGVAGDVISGWIGDGIDTTCLYFPTAPGAATSEVLLVRVKGEPEAVRRALDDAIAGVAAGSVSFVLPVEQGVALQVYPFRAASWIASFLGALALVLSLSGIYGVLSYLVSQRTKEIGIRMALGATTSSVVRIVLRQSMKLALVGIIIGAVLALGVSRLFASELQNVDTFDALAYFGSIAVALAAALAAAYVPSRRAAGVDPVTALRCD